MARPAVWLRWFWVIGGWIRAATWVSVPLLLASENLALGFLIRGSKGEIETMTVKEWAEKISGFGYPADELDDLNKEMAADGIIIAYGISDDLLEFRGVVCDEVGAWEGTEALIASRGKGTAFIFDEEKNAGSAEFNRKEISSMHKIKAIWAPKDDNEKCFVSWLIETEIPHETFDIMEDGDLYCRGVVFHVNDVKAVR
jgi:hypothetical protein